MLKRFDAPEGAFSNQEKGGDGFYERREEEWSVVWVDEAD